MDNNKEEAKQEEKKEEKIENKEFKQFNSPEKVKVNVGTIGNYMLAFFIIIIIATGSLIYYLIHNAKNNFDQQYNVNNFNVVTTDNKDNQNVETIADVIDSALSNTISSDSSTATTTTAPEDNTKKSLNQELVVLYNGLILDTSNMDEVKLQYIDSTSADAEKYVITYYSYENFSFKESKLGILSSQVYENLVKVDNVGKIAISEDYQAIPRDVKVVNTVPTIVLDNNKKISEYDTVKTIIVDLDGNQTDEYILVLKNKNTGYSKITLIDSNGTKVADLASIEKSKWKKDTTTEYYLSLSNVEVIDVDNDGIMEIVVEIPQATGNSTISLLKYKGGNLQGKTGIECSLIGE